MILKILDYRQAEENSGVYEEWNFFDNITSASNYFDDRSKTTVVRCQFRDGSVVTFSVLCVAYLMSDTGKTIEKIVGACVEELGDTDEAVYNTLQEAVEVARKESIS